MMFHVASATASEPASGVHKPANRSIPIVIAETAKTEKWKDGPASSLSNPWITKQNPATSRISNRPAPGQPERTWRITVANTLLTITQAIEMRNCDKSPKRADRQLFRVSEIPDLRLDNSAFYPDHRSVGSIVRA
jgi:hypothetical protein